ncbi:inhibitor of nuclear factor kappa-B kinase subunit alpha [Belonocnema kinseyi]|uniref:inhibitor of nuclear factor kappa-B kinase subunit alpha n=1 Tax=Belonocnema kinseyi TaxID=2817044 RepID=UPI00143D21AA|nr:inhibitor of nuclear factor kappa-B kinase subunit alpha [Belonocnema kinseyi]XP_033226581.1 inhibitor of nuclear factor kappa-B kinase subunit alpha [Belonocnema kinseyi]XP_033226582.1 inhibitor of nuclear factor kappa-B kinase subunit alpha [Belonocnema kinseyi]
MAGDATKTCGGWILERNLGSGGFGIVEFWKNSRSGEKIAIKKCKDVASLSEKQKDRWNKEVLIMQQFDHPNLIKSVKVPGEIEKIRGQLPVLCMEYCSRGDLRKFLKESKNICGIEQLKAIKIMSDIASGVEFLHQNKITHRDLKPENIVLDEKNGKITYKLIDLGLAKELGQDSLYASLVGSKKYVAPELFLDKKYSCSVDYWSLGILFYEVLTGTRPFLSHMEPTATWMNAVQKKKYEQICAHEINGKINLYTDIADPNDLSESMRRNIVEWFRVALQWDPRKRGKLPGTNEVVLFNMWKTILLQKELHVFLTSEYRIIIFPLDEKSTLENLQQWIEEQTKVPSDQQIITDFEGRLLNKGESLISQVNIQSEAPHVIILKNGNLHFDKLPDQNLPKPIERILKNPNEVYDYHERIQYIKAVLFFINQDIRFSKWYQIALSIKIDLLEQRSASLEENLKNAIESTSRLKSEVEEILKEMENQITQGQRKAFQEVIKKIEEKPLIATTQMTKKFENLKKVNEDLRKFAEINWIRDFSDLFDKAVDIYRKENGALLKARVDSTTKIVFQFLGFRSSKLEHNVDIRKTTENISYLEEELSKLEKFLNSANVLKTVYSTEFQELLNSCKSKVEPESGLFSITNSSNNSLNPNLNNPSGNESDNLIRDSLVTRHLFNSLVRNLQEKRPEILDFDL